MKSLPSEASFNRERNEYYGDSGSEYGDDEAVLDQNRYPACSTIWGITIKPLSKAQFRTRLEVSRFVHEWLTHNEICDLGFYYEQDKIGVWHAHGKIAHVGDVYPRAWHRYRGWRIWVERLWFEDGWDEYIVKDQV